MHSAPWNADYGYAEDNATEQMGKRNPYTADKEPKDVHEHVQTAGALLLVNDMRAEWPQCKNAQPQVGNAERNADNGNHEQK